MFCSKCGTKIEEGIKFCTGCGNAVNEVPNEPVASIVQQPAVLQPKTPTADEKYCSSCDAVIKKEAQICPKCGVRQSAVPLTTNKNTGKAGVIFLCLSLVLPQIPCIYYFFTELIRYDTYNRILLLFFDLLSIAGIVCAVIAVIKLKKIFE